MTDCRLQPAPGSALYNDHEVAPFSLPHFHFQLETFVPSPTPISLTVPTLFFRYNRIQCHVVTPQRHSVDFSPVSSEYMCKLCIYSQLFRPSECVTFHQFVYIRMIYYQNRTRMCKKNLLRLIFYIILQSHKRRPLHSSESLLCIIFIVMFQTVKYSSFLIMKAHE